MLPGFLDKEAALSRTGVRGKSLGEVKCVSGSDGATEVIWMAVTSESAAAYEWRGE
jgi:hypothetical protein